MASEIPGYVLLECIASGATASVWRAEAVGTPGHVVAIKLVAHENGRAAIEALRREGEILARLSHPSILQVVDLVPTDDGLALVMPYAAGGSLARVLAEGSGGLPSAFVADVGARLASALAALHGAGIVHRDVKPANILFDLERQPLLGDVGIARLRDDAPTLAGTPEYLDPRVIGGGEPDAHSDLYALGATLYEAQAGVPPYAGGSPAQTASAAERGRFVPLSSHVEAPVALTTAIEAAFARDPRDRPVGAHNLAAHLDEIRRSMPPSDDGPPPHPPATTGRAGVLGAVPHSARPSPRLSDAGRSPTVHYGPRPPSPVEVEPASRVPRTLLIVAAATVAIVPFTAVGISMAIASAPGPPAQTAAVATVGAESGADAPPREVAPPCDGSEARTDQPRTVLADVAGRGCSAVVVRDGRQLEVQNGSGSPRHYDLGARPDDVLLFGDWTCDGPEAPALYRPADGLLFTFDRLADDGDPRRATGRPTGVIRGSPRVVTDERGCDRVEVAP